MSIYLARNGKMLTRLSGTRYFGSSVSPVPPTPTTEVTIGNQTWSTKNLAVDDGGDGIATKVVNYCYGDVVEYYYSWPAAVRIANGIEGWHLPSVEEYETLASNVGGISHAGTKLKSTYGWDPESYAGTDDYGFCALPAGIGTSYSSEVLELYDFGKESNFWTSSTTTGANTYAVCKYFNGTLSMNAQSLGKYGESEGKYGAYCTVRLIKDQA
jgi:uncharacterized protein (TIGR02145 family)